MDVPDLSTNMCDACYGYIHDALLSPLPCESIFHRHIHRKSLERVIHKVASSLLRVMTAFKHGDLFFVLPTHLTNSDPIVASQTHDEYIWKQFQSHYPNSKSDLNYIIDVLVDHSVIRKTAAHHQLAEIYVKSQFHAILKLIKGIHHEHSNKVGMIHQPSLGPVPPWKLAMIQAKAKGGDWMDYYKIPVPRRPPPPPPSNRNQKLSIQIPACKDEDRLYW